MNLKRNASCPTPDSILDLLDNLLPDKKVKDFSIHFTVGGPPYLLRAEILLDEKDIKDVAFALQEFELVEKKEKEDDSNAKDNG